MRLLELISRDPAPEPWSEEGKIPWDDPEFSARMLAEHLSQAHDAASRRSAIVEQQVGWIHRAILGGKPSRVLDLGCGPGLYTAALAQLGHACVGIDFGPASIAHARRLSEEAGDANRYVLGDIRVADYGTSFDLVMLIYGELNVFTPSDARLILGKARAALSPGGTLLLEAHTWESVRAMGSEPPTWRSRPSGLFSPRPHLVLNEAFWNVQQQVAIQRHYVVDAAAAEVTRYGQSVQAYTDDEYAKLLAESGFRLTATHPSLTGDDEPGDFVVLLATPA